MCKVYRYTIQSAHDKQSGYKINCKCTHIIQGKIQLYKICSVHRNVNISNSTSNLGV